MIQQEKHILHLRVWSFRFYLSDRQDGHGEDERDGPGSQMEVGRSARQWLLGGAQSFE